MTLRTIWCHSKLIHSETVCVAVDLHFSLLRFALPYVTLVTFCLSVSITYRPTVLLDVVMFVVEYCLL